MIPPILIQIGLIIIVIRSGYAAINHTKGYNKNILELLYNIAICVIALSFLI